MAYVYGIIDRHFINKAMWTPFLLSKNTHDAVIFGNYHAFPMLGAVGLRKFSSFSFPVSLCYFR